MLYFGNNADKTMLPPEFYVHIGEEGLVKHLYLPYRS